MASATRISSMQPSPTPLPMAAASTHPLAAPGTPPSTALPPSPRSPSTNFALWKRSTGPTRRPPPPTTTSPTSPVRSTICAMLHPSPQLRPRVMSDSQAPPPIRMSQPPQLRLKQRHLPRISPTPYKGRSRRLNSQPRDTPQTPPIPSFAISTLTPSLAATSARNAWPSASSTGNQTVSYIPVFAAPPAPASSSSVPPSSTTFAATPDSNSASSKDAPSVPPRLVKCHFQSLDPCRCFAKAAARSKAAPYARQP